MDVKNQLIETWMINNRVNLKILNALGKEEMGYTLSKRGGRTVALQFAHMHNNRMYRLEKYGKEYLAGMEQIDPKGRVSKSLLKKALNGSARTYSQWIGDAIANEGKVKGFKRGVIPMIGYLISHEAHHRGSILLTLKECGHPLDKDTRFNIWAWNQI